MRETIVKPLGLVTQPNKYGQYPSGALSRAENLVIRSPGTLEQLFGRVQLAAARPGALGVYNLFALSNGNQFEFVQGATKDELWWILAGVPFAPPFEDASLTNPYSFTMAPLPIMFRSRAIINTDYGIIAADTGLYTTLRFAGMPQPIVVSAGPLINLSGIYNLFLAANAVVGYSAVIRRVHTDGYELISEPSPIVRTKNTWGSPAFGQVRVRFGPNSATRTGRAGVRAGDTIEVYRTPQYPSATANLDTDAGTDLYLAKTYKIIAADLVTNEVLITDDCAELALGKSLYTNPSQESLQGARRRPPQSRAIGKYKGFSFYGSIVDPPRWEARFPGGLGTLDNAAGGDPIRKSGIGRRVITGTATLGSPTITAISASHIIGLAVGQRIYVTTGAGWAGVQTIAAVGATSITLGGNSSANSAVTLSVYDVLEVNGQLMEFPDLAALLQALGTLASPFPWFSVAVGATVAYKDASPITGALSQDWYQLTFSQSIAIEPYRFVDQSTITIRGTNGQNYDPPIPTMGQTAQSFAQTPQKNRLYWSWDQQPEAVAPGCYMPAGYGEILAMAAVRDGLFIFCTDGLYRLTGYGTRSSGIGAQWNVELIDSTFIIASRRALCVLRDRVYAYGNLGLVEISDAGAMLLSDGIIGDLLPGYGYVSDTDNALYWMVSDDTNDEVWLALRVGSVTSYYIYNEARQAFTSYTAGTNDAAAAYDVTTGLLFAHYTSDIDSLLSTVGEPATADYQPIYAGDPMAAKQWIDMTVMFDAESQGIVVTPRFNGVAWPGATLRYPIVGTQNDARRTFGVPRNAPAVGHLLAPGVSLPSSAANRLRLRGISLRYQPFGEQQLYR